MTLRSRLFAGVALPLISAALITAPAYAGSRDIPYEIAQASDEQQPEILPEEQPQAQAPAEEAQPEAEAPVKKRKQRKDAEEQQEQAPAVEQQAEQPAAEQAPAEAAQPEEQPEAPVKKRKQRKDAEQSGEAQQEQAPAAEQQAEQPAAEQAPAAEQPAAEQAPAEAAQPEVQPETPVKPRKQRKNAEQSDEAAPATQPPAAEGQPQPEAPADQQAQPDVPQPSTGEAGSVTPAPDAAGQQTEGQQPEAPAIVDTKTVEEKKAIAADPSKTDETIVLPVEGGAAVLDSDKDADNRGGQTSREERRRQREAQRTEEQVAPPKTDAEAQGEAVPVKAEDVRQQIEEKGQRIEKAPVFTLPAGPEGQTPDGGTTINNTVNNNTTVNNITVVQQNDNRAVLQVDDRLVVRGDDRPRLRRDAEETTYERLPRGRYRETIERPNGVRLVTVYNRYGDVIQRSRIGRDGEEYLLVYAPDAERDRPPMVRDIGDDLPPMRLRIPVEDYIIDTSSEPDRDYYDFLAEPPVERVERTYSLDEVKYSARLRDKVRRIDLDTITFATGSAEVPMNQARTLRKVADAIQKVLERDQGETFLIEGHTDAVGSDQSNLILSDERADSVANLLTEVYGIPPENLTTQGYGERYLKVRTQAAEQQNRRVTIRRVTPLVRPAQAQ